MAGFGKPKHGKKIKPQASRSQTDEATRQALNAYQKGDLASAKTLLEKTLQVNPENSFALGFLATIEKALENKERALELFERSTRIDQNNPDILHNYSILLQEKNPTKAVTLSNRAVEISPSNSSYLERNGCLKWKHGDLENALAATIKAIELKPDLIDAHINLGGIYKDLGQLDHALASTLKSLELKPDNPTAHMNLGGIYKDLGDLDQALASTLKSLELKPEASKALYLLGNIKMALGKTEEARKDLLDAIACDTQECEAYRALSAMIETTEEAEELIESIKLVKTSHLTPQRRLFIEFALSNCFHKIKNYDQASKHLQLANKNKLITYHSNASRLQQEIANNLSRFDPAETTTINTNYGKDRIFIVGMPRSGSTLLETILSMNPEIKDLGESRSLKKQFQKSNNRKYAIPIEKILTSCTHKWSPSATAK